MRVQALHRRLLQPEEDVDIAGLAARWREVVIEARLAGMGAYARCPSLLNKVRGALGRVLLESASEETRRRLPCGWARACAAEVLFGRKPAPDNGGAEIAKPFVLEAAQRGADLLVRLRLFGMAGEWAREVAQALVAALRGRVRWRDLARDEVLFTPADVAVSDLVQRVCGMDVAAAQPAASLRLEFLTPVDAERGSLVDDPWLLFERLLMRLGMLARWQGVRLADDGGLMAECWHGLACEAWRADGGGRVWGGHRFLNRVDAGVVMSIEGELEPLWPLLVLGERVHVGRGATVGLGRYQVVVGEDDERGPGET